MSEKCAWCRIDSDYADMFLCSSLKGSEVGHDFIFCCHRCLFEWLRKLPYGMDLTIALYSTVNSPM
jgi:hypothetical protein